MKRYDVGPETERLRLRAATVDDAAALYAMNSDPEVMRHTGEPMPASVEDMVRLVRSYPDFERHGYGRWVCEWKATGEVIGFAGLKVLEDLGEVDVGYRLMRAWWGRGIATEAAAACVSFGFEVIGLERVIGLVMPQNAASVRVLEKIGMRFSGSIEYDGTACDRYVVHSPFGTGTGTGTGASVDIAASKRSK